jgi:glycosidase
VAAALIIASSGGCGQLSGSPAPAGQTPGGASPGGGPQSPSLGGAPTAQACDVAPAPPSQAPAAWWADRVFYEVFVRSFQDSDGDGIGDLRGLTSRLDALNDGNPATTTDLGVTALWLMPVAESPSYHGYDVVDYRAIESDYGTAADFRSLMAAAHARGINVIVDLVLNHTSRDHPWFQDAIMPGSGHDDWYVWAPKHPGYARSDGAPVWHTAGGRVYFGYFSDQMPDLNLANPEVAAELDAIGRFWLDEMDVDGFRLDAARHLIEDGPKLENTAATKDWLAAYRSRLQADHPDAMLLGEVWDPTSMSSSYVRDEAVDMTFDFGLASATLTSLKSGDAGSLKAALGEIASAYPVGGMASFLTNHDQDRVINQLRGDTAAARLAATLLLTSRGSPFIYYGEEIGLTGSKPDEQIRRPMRWDGTATAGFTTGSPWEPLGDDPPGTDVAAQKADPASLLSAYRELISLRTAHPALATGDLVTLDSDAPSVLAVLRSTPDERLVVISNLSAEGVTGPLLGLADGPLCGQPSAEVVFGGAPTVTAPQVTATGGLADWRPLDKLDPRQTVVIRLAP